MFNKNDIKDDTLGTCKTARTCSNPSYYPNLFNSDDTDDDENSDGFNYDEEN